MEEITGIAAPEDAQKWISEAEAAEMLRLSRPYFMQTAKKRGCTRRKANRNAAPFFLRKEIEAWADFRGLRRKWFAKYPGADGRKRYTKKFDLETAQRLFITTKEAAALLGLAQSTIRRMVRTRPVPNRKSRLFSASKMTRVVSVCCKSM